MAKIIITEVDDDCDDDDMAFLYEMATNAAKRVSIKFKVSVGQVHSG